MKKLPPLQLAKTCSTCKYAMFGTADYRLGGKKQGGICLLACDLPKPKKPADWAPLPLYELPRLKEAFKTGVAPALADYMTAVKKLIEKRAASDMKPYPDQVENWYKKIPKQEQYYLVCQEWDQWWRDNYPLVRHIHRQTFCTAWEDGPKSRENQARNLVKD